MCVGRLDCEKRIQKERTKKYCSVTPSVPYKQWVDRTQNISRNLSLSTLLPVCSHSGLNSAKRDNITSYYQEGWSREKIQMNPYHASHPTSVPSAAAETEKRKIKNLALICIEVRTRTFIMCLRN